MFTASCLEREAYYLLSRTTKGSGRQKVKVGKKDGMESLQLSIFEIQWNGSFTPIAFFSKSYNS